MSDVRLSRLANVLVGFCADVRQGDLVTIEAPLLAEPLVRETYAAVLRAGAHPLTRLSLEGLHERLLRAGSNDQLDWVNPSRLDDIETVDVRIVIDAPSNTKRYTSVDPERAQRSERASERIRNRYLDRAAEGSLRWVLTCFPTQAAAQDASMSLAEYEDFVYHAQLLDEGDPIDNWRALGERIERVAELLAGKDELRIVAADTDLTMRVGGRSWIRADGHENFPDGEVFTAPHETSVEGAIRFTYPAVFQGREVDDVRLRFHEGEVVEATAARGGDYLEAMLAVDDGARRVGEFAFGLNDAVTMFTRDILFDEKLGGSVHLALGTAYPESGGLNRSALHWDMICDLRDGGEVYADGELVYRDGAFLNGAA